MEPAPVAVISALTAWVLKDWTRSTLAAAPTTCSCLCQVPEPAVASGWSGFLLALVGFFCCDWAQRSFFDWAGPSLVPLCRAEGISMLALFEQLNLFKKLQGKPARDAAKPQEDAVFTRIDPEIDDIRNGNVGTGCSVADHW